MKRGLKTTGVENDSITVFGKNYLICFKMYYGNKLLNQDVP